MTPGSATDVAPGTTFIRAGIAASLGFLRSKKIVERRAETQGFVDLPLGGGATSAVTSLGASSAAAHAAISARTAADAFLSLVKTCAKLKIAVWDYLGGRLVVPAAKAIPHLPEIILARARAL